MLSSMSSRHDPMGDDFRGKGLLEDRRSESYRTRGTLEPSGVCSERDYVVELVQMATYLFAGICIGYIIFG